MFRDFNPKELELRDIHQLLLGSIAPRPIGFAGTISKNGYVNLAPFSYHNVFSTNPPIIGISPAYSGKTGKAKNTLSNILETKEFTLSVVTYDLVEQMNLCSAEFSFDISEFDKSGLSQFDSQIVTPPGVKESPIIMECKFLNHIELSKKPAGGNLILGEIVKFHINKNIFDNKGKINPIKVDQVARLGYNWYTRASQGLFELSSPKYIPIGVESLPNQVRNCKYFKGKHLARLASVEKIRDKEKNKDLISTYSRLTKDDMLKICSVFIEEGKIFEAWQILYIADIIK